MIFKIDIQNLLGIWNTDYGTDDNIKRNKEKINSTTVNFQWVFMKSTNANMKRIRNIKAELYILVSIK